ncbi:hypothetical protein VDGL01_11925 [Verticillium dahliae]
MLKPLEACRAGPDDLGHGLMGGSRHHGSLEGAKAVGHGVEVVADKDDVQEAHNDGDGDDARDDESDRPAVDVLEVGPELVAAPPPPRPLVIGVVVVACCYRVSRAGRQPPPPRPR